MNDRIIIDNPLDVVNEKYYNDVIAFLQQIYDKQTNDEIIDAAAMTVLHRYHKAFEELAK